MKKLFITILAFMLLMTCTVSAVADDMKKLSEMSNDEITEFITDYQVQIPLEYAAMDETTFMFIRHVISEVEENPAKKFVINYKSTLDFCNAIKSAVNDYYHVDLSTVPLPSASH